MNSQKRWKTFLQWWDKLNVSDYKTKTDLIIAIEEKIRNIQYPIKEAS